MYGLLISIKLFYFIIVNLFCVMNEFPLPQGHPKELRACNYCGLLQSQQQFVQNGCLSCNDDIEKTDENQGKIKWPLKEVQCHTTHDFDGVVGIIDSNSSWIARLVGKKDAPIGVYATSLTVHNRSNDDENSDDSKSSKKHTLK